MLRVCNENVHWIVLAILLQGKNGSLVKQVTKGDVAKFRRDSHGTVPGVDIVSWRRVVNQRPVGNGNLDTSHRLITPTPDLSKGSLPDLSEGSLIRARKVTRKMTNRVLRSCSMTLYKVHISVSIEITDFPRITSSQRDGREPSVDKMVKIFNFFWADFIL